MKSGVLVLFLLQFALLRYSIAAQIPTTADAEAGAQLLQNLLREPGDVYVPYHPELMLLAGRKTYADWTSLYELSGGFGGQTDRPEWRKVNLQLRKAIRTGEFDLILLDREQFWAHPERYYQLKEVEYPDEAAFYPVTGWRIRPSIAYYLND
jgi:hypothetical protein